MSTIRAVLFDLDQTLLDRTTSLKRFLNWQVDCLQLVPKIEKEKFIQCFIELDANGTVWKDVVYRQLIQKFKITQFNTQELEQQLLNSYIQDFNQFCVAFAGVETVIQTLFKVGYSLGLISNGKTPFQEHNFQALGLSEYFSCILVSEAIGLRKPQPEIFQMACQQMNVIPEQCVMIGVNEIADIQGAKNIGMQTILFNAEQEIKLTQADDQVQCFGEILSIILKI